MPIYACAGRFETYEGDVSSNEKHTSGFEASFTFYIPYLKHAFILDHSFMYPSVIYITCNSTDYQVNLMLALIVYVFCPCSIYSMGHSLGGCEVSHITLKYRIVYFLLYRAEGSHRRLVRSS